MHRVLIFPRFKYPKLFILVLSYVFAFFLFSNNIFLKQEIALLGYLGIFLAGAFYSYGFTSGPATALIFFMSKSLNIFAAGIIGGLGSLLGDFLIFEFIRVGFEDEIKKLSHEHLFRNIKLPKIILPFVIPILAAIFIASPLPDEIGVSMLAASKIKTKDFAVFSYVLNTFGIFVILILGA